MESATKLFHRAISVFQKKGFAGLISYIKKLLGVDHIELTIISGAKVWNWPSNKLFNQIKLQGSGLVEFAGAVVELPFFVSSSESIPIPLQAYKLLRDHNFKGCYVTSATVDPYTVLLGCFSEEPLKLTDSKIQLVQEILTQALTQRVKKQPTGNLQPPKASEKNSLKNRNQVSKENVNLAFVEHLSRLGLYVLATDTSFQILHLGGDVATLTGVKPDALVMGEQKLDEIVDPVERKRFIRIARAVIRSSAPRFETFKVRNALTGRVSNVQTLICCSSLGTQPILLAIGLPIKQSQPKIEILNLESLKLIVELLSQLAQNPNNFKGLISSAFKLFRGLIPVAKATILAVSKGSKLVPVLGDFSRTETSTWRKISDVAVNSKIAILEYATDENSKIILLKIGGTHSPMFFIYEVDRSFELQGYKDLLDTAIRVASMIFSVSTSTYSQAHFVKQQRTINKHLSKLWSLKNLYDLGQKALEVATTFLPSVRGWIGVVNSQKTHLEGIGGFGPGVGLRVSRSQVELVLRHDYLDEAIREKKCKIVPAGAKMECSGFNDIMKRLNVGLMVIQPILYEGDVIGVIILEPIRSDRAFINRVLPLLDYLSFYIGLVVNALRFEYRIFEADKMKTISVFSAGLAHYLNNIFQSVIGNLSLVEQKLDSELKEMVSRSLDATRRGASLVRRLNEMAGPSTKSFELVDINQLIVENRELYSTLLEPTVKLELDLGENIRQIVGSKGSIQQALLNVILNAKEAIEPNREGKVVVRTRNVKLTSNQVDPLLPPGKYVEVKVIDNGRGMTEDELHSCFEPFFSTKSSKSALWPGLGLATTYSIMRAHGGLATAASTPGLGTEISLFFPYPLTAVLETKNPNRTVYIYSDDQKLVTELRSLLSSLGKEVALLDSETLYKNSVILLDLDSETVNSFDTKLLDTCSVIGLTRDRNKVNSGYSFPVISKPVSIWKLARIIE